MLRSSSEKYKVCQYEYEEGMSCGSDIVFIFLFLKIKNFHIKYKNSYKKLDLLCILKKAFKIIIKI